MAIPVAPKYVRDFEKLGFGMFVHFGLYSQMKGGEWVKHESKIPMKEYEKLMDTFTAETFDAKALVRTAKEAGAKYIVLTTRHHEGFSLFDTCGLSDFDAPHSPAKRDLIREYVDACNEEGIVPFFYHTTLDWHEENFVNAFPKYLEYLRKSVEVLCTKYGKIGGLWFDGNWFRPHDDWHEDELYATIRKHQPEAIIINNTGLGARGRLGHPEIDSVTFENGRAQPMDREGMSRYVAAEMCQTMNDHWGYTENDFHSKSTGELIETLCACRKVGANYLLNIGPTEQGGVDPLQRETLRVVGKWLKIFGDAIYETVPCGVTGEHKNFGLKNEKGEYFLFVHDLARIGNVNVTVPGGGNGPKDFMGLPKGVKSVTWMDNDEPLSFKEEDDKLVVNCTGYRYGRSLVVRVAKVTY